jgi:hypothetical protein
MRNAPARSSSPWWSARSSTGGSDSLSTLARPWRRCVVSVLGKHEVRSGWALLQKREWACRVKENVERRSERDHSWHASGITSRDHGLLQRNTRPQDSSRQPTRRRTTRAGTWTGRYGQLERRPGASQRQCRQGNRPGRRGEQGELRRAWISARSLCEAIRDPGGDEKTAIAE